MRVVQINRRRDQMRKTEGERIERKKNEIESGPAGATDYSI